MLPAGAPDPTVDKIREAVLRVLRQPEVREKMMALGLEPAPSEGEDVAGDMRKEIDYWKRAVAATGI